MKAVTTLLFTVVMAGTHCSTSLCAPGEQNPTFEPSTNQSLKKPVIFTLDEATINKFREQGELEANIDPRDENQKPLGLECVIGFILTKHDNQNPNLLIQKLNRQDSGLSNGIIRFRLKESDIQSLQTCRLAYELPEEERGRFTKVQFAYFNDQAIVTHSHTPFTIANLNPVKPTHILDGETPEQSPQRQDFTPPSQQQPKSMPFPENFSRISKPSWPTGLPDRPAKAELPPPNARFTSHADDIPAESPLGLENRNSPSNNALNMAEQKFVDDVSSDVANPTEVPDNKTVSSSRGPTFLIYVMLLISLGFNIYLVMISRGFYVRYGKLAAELRETFTTNF